MTYTIVKRVGRPYQTVKRPVRRVAWDSTPVGKGPFSLGIETPS